ncbi:hypothetical protein D3C84_1095940 [compost metagenome]
MCSRIRPPAVQYVIGKEAEFNIGIVHVRNLELATTGRLQRFNDIEHLGVVHVNTRYSIIALRLLRLLFDRTNLAAV